MKIKMNSSGEIREVSQEVGSREICSGHAEVVEFDKPVPDAPRSVIEKAPEPPPEPPPPTIVDASGELYEDTKGADYDDERDGPGCVQIPS